VDLRTQTRLTGGKPPARVAIEVQFRVTAARLRHKCAADFLNKRGTPRLNLSEPEARNREAHPDGRASLYSISFADYFASEQSHPPAQSQERPQLQASPQPQRSTLVSTHAQDALSHWQDSLLEFSMVSPVFEAGSIARLHDEDAAAVKALPPFSRYKRRRALVRKS
jgi:hypothetical protein